MHTGRGVRGARFRPLAALPPAGPSVLLSEELRRCSPRSLTSIVSPSGFTLSFPASLALPRLTCPVLRISHQVHYALYLKWPHYRGRCPFTPTVSHHAPPPRTHAQYAHQAPLSLQWVLGILLHLCRLRGLGFRFLYLPSLTSLFWATGGKARASDVCCGKGPSWALAGLQGQMGRGRGRPPA